jgi:hypothetical protein
MLESLGVTPKPEYQEPFSYLLIYGQDARSASGGDNKVDLIDHAEALTETEADNEKNWLIDAEAELDEIQTLAVDWDGHGASQIAPEACQTALAFLRVLPKQPREMAIYPEPDGNVGVEWHRGKKFSMYMSFEKDGTFAYVAVFRREQEEVHRGFGVKMTRTLPDRIKSFVDDYI